MEVILLENIHNLGKIGDAVKVKPGFARNYLFPAGKVLAATPDNLAEFEKRRAELEEKAASELAELQKRADAITKLESIAVQAKASEEGKLYGSIGPREVAEAVTNAGCDVQKSEVNMPEGAIHTTGEFDIALQLHGEVSAHIKIVVEAE